MLRIVAAVALLVAPSIQSGQNAGPEPFERIAFMVGRWEGPQEGQPGTGRATREYTRVLNGRFLRVTNRSEYPIQQKNPKGELHHDEGYLSFDRARGKLVLRQFHQEGFFNQYVEDDGSTPAKIVFTSEALENVPAGWKARETYLVLGPDEFEEVFELAQAGKPFEVYSRARFKRVK
jgi:hypothetical protein